MASVRRRVKDDPKSPWIVTYTDPVSKKRIQGGTYERQKDALARKREIETEIEGGYHTATSASVTLRQAAESFLKDCDRRHKIGDRMSGATLRAYTSWIETQIIPRFDAKLISELTRDEVQEWIDELSVPYKRKTVQYINTVLNEIMKFAVRKKWARRNVLKEDPVTIPGSPQKRVAVPTKEDIRALLRVVDGALTTTANRGRNLNRAAMVVLGIFAGMRRGEIAGLHWEDVDFENGVINVRRSLSMWDGLKAPKTHAGIRRIPMVDPVKRVLLAVRDYWALREEMYDERSPTNTKNYFSVWHVQRVRRGDKPKPGRKMTGHVLRIVRAGSNHGTSDSKVLREWAYGRPMSLRDMSEGHWRRVMVAAGLVEDGKTLFSMHAMRHAAASLLIEEGVPALVVKDIMGHASVQTTFDVYGHLFPDDSRGREALNNIAASFDKTPDPATNATL